MTDELNQAGAGQLAIGVEDKRVVIKLPPGKDWIALDPDVSARVAEELIFCVMQCGVKVVIPEEKKELSIMQRAALDNRIEIVLREMIEKKAKPSYMAKTMVDVVLRGFDQ